MPIEEKLENSTVPIAITSDLHSDGLLRLDQIIGTAGARQSKTTSTAKDPFYHPLFPVSRSKFYLGIRQGLYPAPLKYGRNSLWRARDILRLVEGGVGHD